MSYSYAQSRTFRKRRYTRRFDLSELFDDVDDVAIKLQIAQHRIVEAFANATVFRDGKLRGTGGYIVGVDKKQGDLVDHIMKHVIDGRRHGIVIASELPSWLGDEVKNLHQVIDDTNRQLVAIRLSTLCQKKIVWFNEYNGGIWDIQQSALDQYYDDLTDARNIRKVDERLRREALHGGGRLAHVH